MKITVPSQKIPLAVAALTKGTKTSITLFSKVFQGGGWKLVTNTSKDGRDFSKKDTAFHIFDKRKKEIPAERVYALRFFSSKAQSTLVVESFNADGTPRVSLAKASGTKDWKISTDLSAPFNRQTTVLLKERGQPGNIVYYSEHAMWAKTGKTMDHLDPAHLLADVRVDRFDFETMKIIAVLPRIDGFLILYHCESSPGKSINLSVGGLLISHKEKGKVVWRSGTPLWHGSFPHAYSLTPLGAISTKKEIILYWKNDLGHLFSGSFEYVFEQGSVSSKFQSISPLLRHEDNPVISPRSEYPWESEGTFNPAAVLDDEGTIHLFYRAIGADGVSRVGYARSEDGLTFTHRSVSPVFEPVKGFGIPLSAKSGTVMTYNPSLYASGGGWAGAEDPRAVRIGKTVYMLYVAFEGWDSVRIALTSISIDDIKNENWKWKRPVHLSPPGQVNKNWLLFPEKIHGKYAILHSIAPHILIEYVDDIHNLPDFIDSPRPQGPQPGRKDFWDNLLRGAGPPPLKTRSGWLLLYHALDKRDAGKYKLGAMILDLDNPSKILYRSAQPILTPDMPYENDGKPGVVYASGAVIKDDVLHVYYGGGDRVVCVASAGVADFVRAIKEQRRPKFSFSQINIE